MAALDWLEFIVENPARLPLPLRTYIRSSRGVVGFVTRYLGGAYVVTDSVTGHERSVAPSEVREHKLPPARRPELRVVG